MIDGEVEVLEIDALPQERGDRFVARTGFDPRALATPYRWFRISPRPIQAWREVNELPDRELWRPRSRVHGARVNNLKHVSVEIPKRRLTVFTGISGSGKSSLVFGTIAAEAQRLINETYSLPRLRRHPTQRCVRDADQRPRRVGAGSGRIVRRDRARLPQPQPPVGTLSGGTWTTGPP